MFWGWELNSHRIVFSGKLVNGSVETSGSITRVSFT
jgi:hypothetical protein